ncbi:hypothetical protein LINPERPRIM_LOCUS4903 [Linum perenne]
MLRRQDPDLVVEAMSSTGSSQSTKQPPSSSSSSRSSNEQPRQRSTGCSTTNPGASATTGQTPSSGRWDRQTIQFSINAWVFVVAVLAIFPLVPKSLSHRAYRLSFMGTACSSLYSLYMLYGRPRAWNLQALQVYLQSIIATKDFIYFIYCLTFVTSNLCLTFALIPILCRALLHVAKFLRRNFNRSSLYRKYLEDPCVWVESNTTTLSILSSHAEIALGFLLVVSLLSVRYVLGGHHISFSNEAMNKEKVHLLKLMYHAPVTAGYHQSVWAKVGRIMDPLVSRYCPFLNTPISAVKRWWLR